MSLSSEPVDTADNPLGDLLREAQWQLNVCNSCRYCEGYCAVFPALARRSELTDGDISHIANICHDCRACLAACMYSPPHEFGVNPPKILSEVRRATYDGPQPRPGRLGRRTAALVGGLATVAIIVVVALISEGTRAWLHAHHGASSPYRVISYGAVLAVGAVPFLGAAFLILRRGIAYWHHTRGPLTDLLDASAWRRALVDAATLRYLRGGGAECNYPDDRPSPMRRHLHGWVAYGFLACVLSTLSAAFEQDILGIRPPYPWLSVPVISGTLGGIGIALGCIGLIALKTRTPDEDIDVPMRARDYALLTALLVLAVTGIAVLLTRTTGAYAPVLVVHLSAVAISFLSAAYSKFTHVLYRMLALVQDNLERAELAAR